MTRNDKGTTISELIVKVKDFLKEREWEKYQNPKDLAESICIEAAELLQLFQWIKSEGSELLRGKPSKLRQIREELADVIIYCLSMANTLDIDVASAVLEKLEQNKKKYPTNLYKGKAQINH